MANMVDFINDVAKNPGLASSFMNVLNEGDANKLYALFIKHNYGEVTLADCIKLVENKDSIINASGGVAPKY